MVDADTIVMRGFRDHCEWTTLQAKSNKPVPFAPKNGVMYNGLQQFDHRSKLQSKMTGGVSGAGLQK